MKFTATDHDLVVDYKLVGKIYNAHPKDIEAQRAGSPHQLITADPFDSELILKGRTWALPANVEWHRERILATLPGDPTTPPPLKRRSVRR